MSSAENKRDRRVRSIAQTILIVLIVSFAFACVSNIYVISNWLINKTTFPAFFGYTPIVVVPDEEAPELDGKLEGGDLFFAKRLDLEKYDLGQTVVFAQNGLIYIGSIEAERAGSTGALEFVVRSIIHGDVYEPPANEQNLIGLFTFRIPLIGYFLLFLGTLAGRILFVGVPLIIYTILFILGMRQDILEGYYDCFTEPSYQKRFVYPFDKVSFGSYFNAIVLTAAAIVCGTHLSKKIDKQQKKLIAAVGATNQGAPADMARPRLMRATRPVRPRKARMIEPIDQGISFTPRQRD